jgi:hypothetical protein
MQGNEWEVGVEWDADDHTFAVDFGGGYAFLYGADGAWDGVNCCYKCGVWHAWWKPHAPTQKFLVWFARKHERRPHWCDLLADCPEDTREALRDVLDAAGRWSEPEEGMDPENATARAMGGLPTHSGRRDPTVMVELVRPSIEESLGAFVGVPNDERAREEMAEAVRKVVDGMVDARVSAEPDPLNPEIMNVQVVYEPRPAASEIRVVDAVVIGDSGGEDGEEAQRGGAVRSAAHQAEKRGEREDSAHVPAPGGKPRVEGVDGVGEGSGVGLRRSRGE